MRCRGNFPVAWYDSPVRRVATVLTICALSACGIGVVGEKPPDASDAGPPTADSGPNVADVQFLVDGAADAALAQCQKVCPSRNCDFDGTCLITCNQTTPCSQLVRCPDGVPCRVTCSDDACENIDCGRATKCEVTCTGTPTTGACHDIYCLGGGRDGDPIVTASCVIDCEGHEACDHIQVRGKTNHVTCNGADDACEDVKCGDGSCVLDGTDKPSTKCCHTTTCQGMQQDPGNCFK